MTLQRWLIFGIVPLVIASCAGGSGSSAQSGDRSVELSDPATQEPVTQEPVTQEPEPSVAQAGESGESGLATEVLKSGNFESAEHPTQGTAQLVRQNGEVVLQFDESFQTSSSGPDLFVALHRSDNVIGSTEPPTYPLVEGEYVVLAPLQDYSGAQSYKIPGDVNLEDYQSAVVWCRQFNATFGAAVLR